MFCFWPLRKWTIRLRAACEAWQESWTIRRLVSLLFPRSLRSVSLVDLDMEPRQPSCIVDVVALVPLSSYARRRGSYFSFIRCSFSAKRLVSSDEILTSSMYASFFMESSTIMSAWRLPKRSSRKILGSFGSLCIRVSLMLLCRWIMSRLWTGQLFSTWFKISRPVWHLHASLRLVLQLKLPFSEVRFSLAECACL